MTIDTKAIEERVAKSMRLIADICAGKMQWLMSIPANPDTDSDLILAATVKDAQALLSALKEKDAEIVRLREALIGARQFLLGVASAIDAALAKEPKS